MSIADVPVLVSDARFLLEYAIRAGKLVDDSLAVAIQNIHDDATANELIALQNAMNTVALRIQPMTLVDLRAGRNPFDRRNVRSRSRWQIGLSLATIFLISIIAYYQFIVQMEQSALIAYRAVVEARGSERITDVRRLIQEGKALSKESCQRDAYQKARHEVRQIAERWTAASTALYQLSQLSPWPFVSLVNHVLDMVPASPVVKQQVMAVGELKAISLSPELGGKKEDLCAATGRSKALALGYPEWLKTVVEDSIDEFCFAQKISVDKLSTEDPFGVRATGSYFGPAAGLDNPASVIDQRLRVQANWLLPFLYGWLGACVYVMRKLLFDTRSAVVENVVIVLRLALGALAGVAIGWFSLPGAGQIQFVAASTFPYFVAFLAGFSIDVVFSLLDGANKLILSKSSG